MALGQLINGNLFCEAEVFIYNDLEQEWNKDNVSSCALFDLLLQN